MAQSFDIRTTDNGKYVVETSDTRLTFYKTFVFDSLQEVFQAADKFFSPDNHSKK